MGSGTSHGQGLRPVGLQVLHFIEHQHVQVCRAARQQRNGKLGIGLCAKG
jgi:hypothetical protein